MRASVQQVYDNRPFSAVYTEKHPDAPSKTSEGYFLGPYQPEEEHHVPEYKQQPPYGAQQYPDTPEGPTDYRPDSDRAGEPHYQPDHERYSAYGRDERHTRDADEPEGRRETHKPHYRPEPEPYQQYKGPEYSGPDYNQGPDDSSPDHNKGPKYKGLNSRDAYRGDSELRSGERYPAKPGYGYDDQEHQGQYDEEDHEEQYKEPRSYEQYNAHEYKDIEPICLQRTSSTSISTTPLIQE